MEKLTEKIAALPRDATYFSLEFFPPKTQAGFSNLQARLSRMAQALRPLFVTVTWGAGGSTAAKSLELAEICQRQLGLTTCLHLTCTNMSRKLVDEALDEAKALGIRNILALRGDPPRSEEYNLDEHEDSNKDFTWAIDLVRYIKKCHGDYFCIGVAGYPEGHADESHPEHQSVEHDLPYLVDKTAAGADFIMTQLTYDLEAFAKYERRLRSHPSGVFKDIPIIPGLMPIQSYQILKRITKLSHANIPDSIAKRVEKVKADDEAVKRVGVDILSEIVQGIRGLPSPPSLPRGLHFYTLNLEKSVAFILERCHLIPPPDTPETSGGSESDSDAVVIVEHEDAPINSVPSTAKGPSGSKSPSRARRRASSLNAGPHNRAIVDRPTKSRTHSRTSRTSSSQDHETTSLSAGVPAAGPNSKTNLLISEGLGSLGREATWDDFPNGRWGPSNSPAFGEIDGYGPSLHVSPAQARKLWGHPTTPTHITNIFKKHLLGDVPCIPWSDDSDSGGDGALRQETYTIRSQLLSLIEDRGWWTIASQPAVNGVRSSDPVFGWGPPNEGFVFQKAFVELFVPRDQWLSDLQPRLNALGKDEVAYLVTDCKGNFSCSSLSTPTKSRPSSPNTTQHHGASTSIVNAVTWGVFRGREIITPTIIEEVSFRAWGEEAFGIWEEWRRVFPRGSPEERFLSDCKEGYVLVNCVGQRFGEGEGDMLWDVLLGKDV